MSDWKIRQAQPSDIDQMMVLWRHLEDAQGPARVFPLVDGAEEMMRAQLTESIGDDGARVIVVEESGELIGMAVAWFEPGEGRLDRTKLVDLSRVIVHPARRAHGIGRALLEAAEDFGRARGASHLQAHLFAGNDAGRAFWERAGFMPRYEARVRPILDREEDA